VRAAASPAAATQAASAAPFIRIPVVSDISGGK
jgi:hypothetical protein